MLKKHHVVQDLFLIPPGDRVTSEPDIAIQELHPDFPEYVGKSALDIETCIVPPLSEVAFAVAVGLPDRGKDQISQGLNYRLSMPWQVPDHPGAIRFLSSASLNLRLQSEILAASVADQSIQVRPPRHHLRIIAATGRSRRRRCSSYQGTPRGCQHNRKMGG